MMHLANPDHLNKSFNFILQSQIGERSQQTFQTENDIVQGSSQVQKMSDPVTQNGSKGDLKPKFDEKGSPGLKPESTKSAYKAGTT